jgi:hypothetical protein
MGQVAANRFRQEAERGMSRWAAVHRVRLGQVRRLLRDRYGAALPDDDAGLEDLRILLHIKAACYAPERREQALASEIAVMAAWMADAKAIKLAAEIAPSPMKLKADTLGRMLDVDWQTRERLKLWQIGAANMPSDIRQIRRRQRDAERKARQRRAEGRKTRNEYLAASLTATKPWEAEGVSRRTWYRSRGTNVSARPVAQVDPQSTFSSSTGQTCANQRRVRRKRRRKGSKDKAHDTESIAN